MVPEAVDAIGPERMGGKASELALLRKLLPLSLTDVVMAVGDPLLTMALSRLANPREVLAAVGIVRAIAVFLESPIIMILHASTALGANTASRRALWRLTLCLGGFLTSAFLLLTWRPLYDGLMLHTFGASPSIAATGRSVLLLVFLWPGVIAWRRFHQGILIRQGRSRQVALASMCRLAWVCVALSVGVTLKADGAVLAGLTLIGSVLVEAIVVTVVSRSSNLAEAPAAKVADADPKLPTTLGGVSRFYAPLAATMILVWGGRAVLTTLVARASDGLLALAAWPAAWGLVLSIANATRMVQQVVISSGGETTRPQMIRFVLLVGSGCSAILLFFGFTSPGVELLGAFLGEHGEIVAAVLPVVRIAALLPLLLASQNALQGLLIRNRKTWRVNAATLVGAVVTLTLATALVHAGGPGASSAAWAMMAGLAIEVLVLVHATTRQQETSAKA